MALVMFMLRRPYTVIASVILLCITGVGAVLRMPVDIFPEINIPVVSVVWTYAGMNSSRYSKPYSDLTRAPACFLGRRH